MSLEKYFTTLIAKLEASDIQNNGKDKDGFFEPTRAMLLQRLNLLRDLHENPRAKAMVKTAWQYVVEHAPAEWLVATPEEKVEISKMLR